MAQEACQKRPIIWQKRPIIWQKRPIIWQKRPVIWQKRPIIWQKRPIIWQKRPIIWQKKPLSDAPPTACSDVRVNTDLFKFDLLELPNLACTWASVSYADKTYFKLARILKSLLNT